jgi:transposase
MPSPISFALRQRIAQLMQSGCSAAQIAAQLRLAPRTVQRLVHQFREHPDDLTPQYRPGTQPTPCDHPLFAFACDLRRQHPTWGAPLIRVHLFRETHRRQLSSNLVPSARTLQRWFADDPHLATPAPSGRKPLARITPTEPHDIWQMDAVEQLRLGNGQGVSWLRLVDQFSGAILSTAVFPPRLLGECVAARYPTATAKRV